MRVNSVHRPARRHRRPCIGRFRRGLVRQRDGRGTERHLQGRTDRDAGTWTGFDQVERAIFQWVTWYNEERLHSALDYVPPPEYERDFWRSRERTTQSA
ncbi:integrase core domain-containing protein [Streptomyces sp. NPDC007095]|uniref:integrase core domain-containing protein n=1 Tax=Streptomyces sp. NPDC007095 TaxID=3154482 RepID=UPI0033FBD522